MNSDKHVGVVIGEELSKYHFGTVHPLGPERYLAFKEAFERSGLRPRVEICKPVLAGRDVLELFHTSAYVDRVIAQSKSGRGYLDYGDTPAVRGIYEAAAYVVGSGVTCLSRILKGGFRQAFNPIAGLHHARRSSAGGFCVFNDCCVLIETLRHQHEIRRIAYVDIDAHHADGVFFAYEDDPDLFFADIHEDGRFLYPGTGSEAQTGRGQAKGTKLNIPVQPRANDDDFARAWERIETFLNQARPEFILFQSGADCLLGDPIAHLCFTAACHTKATTSLSKLAEQWSHGRLLVLGGGGYNLANLSLAWTAVVQTLTSLSMRSKS